MRIHTPHLTRARWAALGAAVAVVLGAGGGIGLVSATVSSGDRPVFVPIEPCRLADTRPAPDTIGDRSTPLPENDTATFAAHGKHGNCDLPATASALAVNVTAIGATAPTYLMLHAAGVPTPPGSQLNPIPGEPPTPNAVDVDLSAGGEFEIFNRFGHVDVIVDVLGYYEHHDHDDRYHTKDAVYTKSEVDAMTTGIAAYDGGNQMTELPAAQTVFRTVSITAPVDGTVIANGSAFVRRGHKGLMEAQCSISTTSELDAESNLYYRLPEAAAFDGTTLAGTRGLPVAAGDTLTLNFVCQKVAGAVFIGDSWLTAMFTAD